MKILFAVDGSKYTQRAAKYLVKHVAEFAARPDIELLYVHRPLPGRAVAAVRHEVVDSYYNEAGEKALAPARRALASARIRCKATMLVGEPSDVIAAYGRKKRFSLVLMGSHGHGAVANAVLGSVVTKVLAESKIPLLIVR